ncbi:hypothetical protein F511_23437 [Dorcoceras hygrometricum]|uniref:Uncharacterized protein n=1 Tax=Dorcoceras hygrometricum TaxID=472368 RepID=A0A2Z7D6B3_9LAMI|nr:hypothetical protein F511_23437 [Dorcoceras hygrometricum]
MLLIFLRCCSNIILLLFSRGNNQSQRKSSRNKNPVATLRNQNDVVTTNLNDIVTGHQLVSSLLTRNQQLVAFLFQRLISQHYWYRINISCFIIKTVSHCSLDWLEPISTYSPRLDRFYYQDDDVAPTSSTSSRYINKPAGRIPLEEIYYDSSRNNPNPTTATGRTPRTL